MKRFNPNKKTTTSILFALTGITLIMGLVSFFFFVFDKNFKTALMLFPLSLFLAILTVINNKTNK